MGAPVGQTIKGKNCFIRRQSYGSNVDNKLSNVQHTLLIQPMDQGMIGNFKHFYRKTLLIRMILKEIEKGLSEKASFAVTAKCQAKYQF